VLLARDGHQVTILERAAQLGQVGAGILLQRLGQRVLADLGLADELERCSSPVRRVDARTPSGRRVMDFGYDDVLPGSYGWGVHRGALFGLLLDAVRAEEIPIITGPEVAGIRWSRAGWLLEAGSEELGPFDLVIGADGARSRVRRIAGLARKDVGYPYGALWSVVPDPEGIVGDVLWQRYDDTRVTLGVLPTGVGQASIFWSIRCRDMAAALAAGGRAWVARARRYAGRLEPLLDRVDDGTVLTARYRDVVVRSPFLVRGRSAIVLVGDAAHAMSPQLGLGASLALADVWTLAACLHAQPGDLASAIGEFAASRNAHVRWYTWLSRLMTPVSSPIWCPSRGVVTCCWSRLPGSRGSDASS
jgi:2-polyprenyl-6-methoxyphenol hydroxylase-like FAD-dependent oxidoreductase